MFKSKFRVGDRVMDRFNRKGVVVGHRLYGGKGNEGTAVIQYAWGCPVYDSWVEDHEVKPLIEEVAETHVVYKVDGVPFASYEDAVEYFYAQREESRSIDDLSLEELQEWYNEYNEYVRTMNAQYWGVFREAYDTTFAESGLSASDVSGEFLDAISRKRNAGNEA